MAAPLPVALSIIPPTTLDMLLSTRRQLAHPAIARLGSSRTGASLTAKVIKPSSCVSCTNAPIVDIDVTAMSRYNNLPLEAVGGTIYELCKDQHGCRYLQKQLENRNPDQIHMIWLETNQHVIELMTHPFGNYLCQKLLEYCNDEERTVLIQNASQDMVRIALNQHGTRALQKMIEFISTSTQIQIIIRSLQFRVVELIQDLNGN